MKLRSQFTVAIVTLNLLGGQFSGSAPDVVASMRPSSPMEQVFCIVSKLPSAAVAGDNKK